MALSGGGQIGGGLSGASVGKQLPDVIDAGSTQTYTFTFEANSSKYNAQTIECNGTIQQIDSKKKFCKLA